MTTASELLTDAFERIRESAAGTVDGLSAEQLSTRPDGTGNSIAWLVWHLARVQDDHIAEVAGRDQVWTSAGWHDRFGLPFEASATGYGQSAEDVAAVQGIEAEQLTGYLDAVHAQTVDWLGTVSESDLDRVIDERWDPPVTLAARLVSVVNDDTQHVGQAAYVRGLL